MLPASDRIVEATKPFTLRPKKNDREKVIAAALEFMIEEYSYCPIMLGGDNDIIDVRDIRDLIEELRSTVTLEELSTRHTRKDLDAL